MNARVLFAALLLVCHAKADTLNEWLESRVRADETMLKEAIAHSGGRSLDQLSDSRNYVPFFLEVPEGFTFESADQEASFNDWIAANKAGFLSGGYIYRLIADNAPPVYATSAGEWSGRVWRSLVLSRDFEIEPDDCWGGANTDYLYATLLSGEKPRLVVYDLLGNVRREDVFDASAIDFGERLDTALKPYSKHGKAIVEMISLAEYLQAQTVEWRPVDASGQFNLRNQQERPEEQERQKQGTQVTRATAVGALRSNARAERSQQATILPAAETQTGGPGSAPESIGRDVSVPVKTGDAGARANWVPWLFGTLVVLAVMLAIGLKRRS